MVILEQISPANSLLFKTTRLEALRESPTAFGSTYAKEAQLSDGDWIKRAEQWSSARSVGYLAMEMGKPCGIVAAFLGEDDPGTAHVVSMWVSPEHRKKGVGLTLIVAIRAWAQSKGARTLQLNVTSSNLTAIRFYQRTGFSMTGKTEPYPNDPRLVEYEMMRSLSVR